MRFAPSTRLPQQLVNERAMQQKGDRCGPGAALRGLEPRLLTLPYLMIHPTVFRISFAGVLLAGWLPLATAQESGISMADPMARAVGLAFSDGVLTGVGPTYLSRLEDGGLWYLPALGDAAEEPCSWSFAVEALGRGDALSATVDRPTAQHDGLVARYVRRHCTETYEMRADGVKQSFVFETLPAGAGDLVVRGRVTTGLPLSLVTATQLRYEIEGVGGVTVGSVVGIDADGRQVTGTLSAHGDVIEMTLPEAFVNEARLPLVLDPLIGSIVPFSSGTDALPDWATTSTTDTYLLVWRRRYSGGAYGILGQRLSSSGALIGNALTLRSLMPYGPGAGPQVANINAEDGFVVVWGEDEAYYGFYCDVMACGVYSATGAVTPVVTVAGGPHHQIEPTVAGDATNTDNDAICVWRDAYNGKIVGAQIELSAGSLTVFGTTDLLTGYGVRAEAAEERRRARPLRLGLPGAGKRPWHSFRPQPERVRVRPSDQAALLEQFELQPPMPWLVTAATGWWSPRSTAEWALARTWLRGP